MNKLTAHTSFRVEEKVRVCDFLVMKNLDQKQVSSIHLGKYFIYKHLLVTFYMPGPMVSVLKALIF